MLNATAPKIVPATPPAPRRFSEYRSKNPGSWMSYIPNKLSAKTTNSPPKKMFMTGWTLSDRNSDNSATAETPSTATMVSE